MLKNFVVNADLLRYHPKLANFIWSTQSDYSVQITEAFNLVLDDLRARVIEARTLMVPVDAMLDATDHTAQNKLTSKTEVVTTAHSHVNGRDGFNRFAVNVSALGGTSGYSIALQGSNDVDVSDGTEPTNWATVATITPIAASETSSVFQVEYKYYRVVNTISTGSTITYTAGIYETYIDRWVMYRTLEMICRDFARVENDVWDKRAQLYQNLYTNAFQNYKFTVDVNDDNRVDDSDENETGQTILVR